MPFKFDDYNKFKDLSWIFPIEALSFCLFVRAASVIATLIYRIIQS